MIIIPLGDNQARGDLAGSVIFERRRGQVMCKKYKRPYNPKSTEQLRQRNKFSLAVDAWQAMTEPEKDIWRNLATGMVMTGYNLFIRNYLNGYFPSNNPLLITQLNNLSIQYLRAAASIGWAFTLSGYPTSNYWGRIYDRENIFYSGYPYLPPNRIDILCISHSQPFDVYAGDWLNAVYDITQNIKIYLPRITGTASLHLYVADDGSTYYDPGMMSLAQAAPPPP